MSSNFKLFFSSFDFFFFSQKQKVMKLKLRKWDAHTHLSKKPGSIILLIGKRGTGKSHLLKYLAHIFSQLHRPDGNPLIDMAIGMSPTDESNETLQAFLPRTLIYSDFSESLFENVVTEQRKRIKQGKPIRRILFFLDDCGFDAKKIFKSPVMKRLFYNGRHVHVGLCFTLQYIMDLDTSFRTNVDITIVLREQIQANRERYYKYFFGQFPTQRAFNMALDACTENYGALVTANNLTISNEINQSVFWMRAPREVPDSRLGNPMLWAMDEQAYEDTEFKEDQTGKTVRRVEPVP